MNFSQADAECKAEGATLATVKQLGDAQQVNHLLKGFTQRHQQVDTPESNMWYTYEKKGK